MARRFDYFVILAEMRTGSNALEDALNSYSAITSHGEIFNPGFIGKAKTDSFFGLSLKDRDAEPIRAIDALRTNTEGLGGFRLFGDHNPEVRDHVLADPNCAKIWLTRNPLDSFVSLQIANTTGQWWLGEIADAKSAQIEFDPGAFDRYVTGLRLRQNEIKRRLQSTGQSAFQIDYSDLGDPDVLNGLVRYLGVSEDQEDGGRNSIVQNPVPMDLKVRNYDEMIAALGQRDHYAIAEDIGYEPDRGPGVPSYVALSDPPLVFLPMRGGPNAQVDNWLADLAAITKGKITRDHTQSSLRKWLRAHPGHRRFTVLAHPLDRAYRAFQKTILATDDAYFASTIGYLQGYFDLEVPGPGCDPDTVRTAFMTFLDFLKANIGGQTPIWTEPDWGEQIGLLQGMSKFAMPDVLLRESTLNRDLAALLEQSGFSGKMPETSPLGDTSALNDLHDIQTESAIRTAHRRDYVMFGFSDWAPAKA